MPIIEADAPVLETERLILRPISLQDAPDVEASCLDWESVQYTSSIPHPYPDGAAERFIAHALDQWASGHFRLLAARARDTGRYIGQVGLTMAEDDPGRAELSYLISRPAWGQGFGTEMAQAGLSYGFETLGLSVIFARVFVENSASNRLARRIGMTFRETGPISAPARNRVVDVHWYELDRTAWESASP